MQARGRPLSFCVMQTKQLPSKGTQHQLWRLTPLPGQSHLNLFRSPLLTPVSSEDTQIKQWGGTELPPKSSAASSWRASLQGQADLSTGEPQPAHAGSLHPEPGFCSSSLQLLGSSTCSSVIFCAFVFKSCVHTPFPASSFCSSSYALQSCSSDGPLMNSL